MGEALDLFEVLHRPEFEGIAPKNLEEMKRFSVSCHLTKGFDQLGDWIDEWILHMEYYMMREWDVNETDSEAEGTD